MSERDSSVVLGRGVSAVIVVMALFGFFGLSILNPSLTGFYMGMLIIPLLVGGYSAMAGMSIGQALGYGYSVLSIVEGEDEPTETLPTAVMWGVMAIVVGVGVSAWLRSFLPMVTFQQMFIPFQPGAVSSETWVGEYFSQLYLSNIGRVLFDVCTVFFVGFVEELAFRGPLFRILFQTLHEQTGSSLVAGSASIGVSSLLFSIYHVTRYGSALMNPYPFAVLFTMGCLWGVLALVFGLLSASMSHVIWDLVAMLAGV